MKALRALSVAAPVERRSATPAYFASRLLTHHAILPPQNECQLTDAHERIRVVTTMKGKRSCCSSLRRDALRTMLGEGDESAMATTQPTPQRHAEAQLKGFIDKFSPEHQKLIRSVRKRLRARFPAAMELAYDNYNFFVIGLSPTERPSDAILSLVAGANGVSICFLHGAKLPDPTGILRGAGNQVRSVSVPGVDTLDQPDVEALFAAAVARSKAVFPERAPRKLIIRSVSAKQRPRRK